MAESEIIFKIIQKITENDSVAFEKFFEMYYSRVYRFAGYFLKSEVLREEVVLDVFFSVWQGRKKLINVTNMEAYLYTSTKNRSLHYIHVNRNHPDITVDHLPIAVVNEFSNPEEIALQLELQLVIDESIKDLPERCRLIFLMAREDGLKHREIAEILSLSEKTVDAQVIIAIKKLGAAIKKYLSVFI